MQIDWIKLEAIMIVVQCNHIKTFNSSDLDDDPGLKVSCVAAV